MEKAIIKALGKVLKQELRLPEDLPFPMQKALEALAELPVEEDQAAPAKTPLKTSNGR
jgi:hypothetical protein